MNIRKAKKKIGGKLLRSCLYSTYKSNMNSHGLPTKPYKYWVIMAANIVVEVEGIKGLIQKKYKNEFKKSEEEVWICDKQTDRLFSV